MFLLDWINAILQALGLSNKQARIVVLGLDNAGKSTLVHKLCKNEVRAFVPTTKAQAQTFTLGKVQFTAWDLGGHEQVRDLWEEYYAGADAIVFMIDSADRERFAESKQELDELLKHEALGETPLLILGNKDDLQESVGKEPLLDALDVDLDADERPMQIFMCSLIAGTGYAEGFKWLSNYL
mmetsp:Transcript_22676/g.55995  ORF Transcript_22676/g.55995 Transcript_22676/m.55995 type:complete len:182 (-) Transcript_22676:349-894(-)